MARELQSLGEQPRVESGGVSWSGDARSLMRANLWLRTASRVIVRVASFRATAFFELEKQAKKIPWSDFLGDDVTPEFRVTARKSKLYHSDAIAERLAKAALGARLSAKTDSRERKAESQLFIVRVERDQFTISADSSGELLHMRGYRQATGKAPLRETLGAALLWAANWNGDRPLIDPFCGSGTIPIEGAMMARRIAPGRNRSFAFQSWRSFDTSAWAELVRNAKSGELAASPVSIAGYDRDAGAIESARANAERAGVDADVEFAKQAVSALNPTTADGLVATNPPYGIRIGADVRNLYAQLGKTLRAKCRGWHLAFYSNDPGLAQQTGLSPEELFRTTNGGIKVAAYAAEAGTFLEHRR